MGKKDSGSPQKARSEGVSGTEMLRSFLGDVMGSPRGGGLGCLSVGSGEATASGLGWWQGGGLN